jgi:hypothetical protein
MLLLHAVATWALVGLIWTVQLAIYPQFAQVGSPGFAAYHARYTAGIGRVVAPLMLVELVTGVLWVVRAPTAYTAWLGLGLIALLWGLTALVQMPQHRRLARGWDAEVARRLVRGNWLRVALWTARGALVIAAVNL